MRDRDTTPPAMRHHGKARSEGGGALRAVLLLISHLLMLAIGFVAGVYVLPIVAAPASPTVTELGKAVDESSFRGTFRKDLAGSDMLHWGEGDVFVGPKAITLRGKLAPGPAYRIYLAPEFVDRKEQFLRVKGKSAYVGDVKTFEHFIVAVPPGIDPARYNTVVIWCEAFDQFITASKYR